MEKIPNQLVNMMIDENFDRASRFTITDSMAKFAVHQMGNSEAVEKMVITILLAIENKFRSYFEANQKELELQRIAAQTLWHLVQRYMIALQVDTSCTCPKIYEIETEETIINKYHMHYQVIMGSNKSQRWAIHALRPYVLAFRRECAKLDLDEETPLILGDAFHKPIKFFIELVDEIFNYFYSGLQQLDCAARLLDPADLKSLENYQKLLAPNEDFDEYFMYNLSFCKCLTAQPQCVPVVRDSHKKEKRDILEAYVLKAKRGRCARRFDKMTDAKSRSEIKNRRSQFNIPSVKNSLSIRESVLSVHRTPSLHHERSLKFHLQTAMSDQHLRNNQIPVFLN